jgi:hypothetical protein
MKLITLAAAATIALAGLATAPALAQPPGQDMHDSMRRDNDRHDNGRANDRDMRRDNGRHNGWDRGRHSGWGHHRNCRWVWRHHHRTRVCY